MGKIIKFKPPYAKARLTAKLKDSKNTTRLYNGKKATKRKMPVIAAKPTKASIIEYSTLSKVKTLRDPNFMKFLIEAEKRIKAQEKLNIKDPNIKKTLNKQKKIIDIYRRKDLSKIKEIENRALKQTMERLSNADPYLRESYRVISEIINEPNLLSDKMKKKLRQNKRFAGAIDNMLANAENEKKILDIETNKFTCHCVASLLNPKFELFDFVRFKDFEIQVDAYVNSVLPLLDLLD